MRQNNFSRLTNMIKLKATRRFNNETFFFSTAVIRRRGPVNSVLRRTRIIKRRSRYYFAAYFASNNRNVRGLSAHNRVSNTRELINGGRFKLISSNSHSGRTLHLASKRISQVPIRRDNQFGTGRNRDHNRSLDSFNFARIVPLRRR